MDYRYRGEEGEEGTVWTEETVIAAGNEGWLCSRICPSKTMSLCCGQP